MAFLIWHVYTSVFQDQHWNFSFFQVLPLGAFIFYLYLSSSNNNIIIDFDHNDILIFKKPFLARLVYPKPKVILFNEIHMIGTKQVDKYNNSRNQASELNYLVYITKKDGSKSIPLIEFTESESKINKELASALINFLKVNIFDRPEIA